MIVEFTQATESDRPYLLRLRKKTMVNHLSTAGKFLSDEEHNERLNHEFGSSFLVTANGNLIGFVKVLSTSAQLEIIQVQVEPRHQNKGYGTGIIQKVLAIGQGKKVKLSVLKANPAKELYIRLGFEVIREDEYEFYMQNDQRDSLQVS